MTSSSNESVMDEVEEFLQGLTFSPETQAMLNLKSKKTPEITAPKKLATSSTDFSTFEDIEELDEVQLLTILQESPEAAPEEQAQGTDKPKQAAPESFAAASQLPHALSRALVAYTTSKQHPSRLFFAHQPFVWCEFYAANGGANADQFGDLTPHQLCAAFCSQVLPHIYTCGLAFSEHEKRCLELLELHPEYERDEDGWRRIKPEARVTSVHEAKARQDLREQADDDDNASAMQEEQLGAAEFQLDSQQPQPRTPQTLVCGKASGPRFGGYSFQFSSENAALLSAALSTDYELSDCTLFEPEELHRRLREAKRVYENTGKMPVNCGNAEELREKLQKLMEMREAISKLLRKKFA